MSYNPSSDLAAAISSYMDWMRQVALPFWAEASRDPSGGFVEELDLAGAPLVDTVRRVRVQARQAYTYAHAHALGWIDGRAASDHGFDQLLQVAAQGDPVSGEGFTGFVHRLGKDHQIADDRRDTYDHAFVLLACAWRIRAFDCAKAKAVASTTLTFLDASMGQADGTFAEGVPAQTPRRQNPHMHLFEAFQALYSATGERAYLDRAKRILDAFHNHFWDADTKVLREFFTEGWSVDPAKGHMLEPGHFAEWAWLLAAYDAVTGEGQPHASLSADLVGRAVTLGRDEASGLLVDQCLADGDHLAGSRRTWVQTEYIRALLVLAVRGDRNAEGALERALIQLQRAYLTADVPGGFIDQFAEDGTKTVTTMPTSTLYHLMGLAGHFAEVVAAN